MSSASTSNITSRSAHSFQPSGQPPDASKLQAFSITSQAPSAQTSPACGNGRKPSAKQVSVWFSSPLRCLLAQCCQKPAWLLVTQAFFALGWLRAASSKVIDASWWSGAHVESFVADHNSLALPWAFPLAEFAVAHAAQLVAVVVVVAQCFVGAALLTNRFVSAALAVGLGMNFVFLTCGAVNPSVFYIVGQGALVLWLLDSDNTSPERARTLGLVTWLAGALLVISVPFAQTVQPSQVIEDPACVLSLVSILTILALTLLRIQTSDRFNSEPEDPSDSVEGYFFSSSQAHRPVSQTQQYCISTTSGQSPREN